MVAQWTAAAAELGETRALKPKSSEALKSSTPGTLKP